MIKKSFSSQEFPNLTVQQLKRYGYSVIMGLGLLSMGAVLLFGSPTFAVAPATSVFDRYVYPVLILAGTGFIWAMLRGRIAIEKFEKPFVVFFALFIIAKFGLTFLSAPTLLPLSHVESWYWMMMGMWVASFLAFSFYPALYINLTVYIAILGVTITNTLLKSDTATVLDVLSDVAASNFRFGAALAAVIILGYVKHQWVFVEKEAMLLRRMAHEDALTGLPNRRWLSETLQKAIENVKENLTVILFDLDGFKRINDRFGHNAGDDVLRQIGTLARQYVRGSDTLGRWGGEEFLVICSDTKLPEGVHLAERLRHMLASQPMRHGRTITGSFGVAELQPHETAEQLVARADAAMYVAKAQGKNQVYSSLVDFPSRPKLRGRLSQAGE